MWAETGAPVPAPTWFDVPAVAEAARQVIINALQDPEVRAEIRSAARPVLIEGAAYMGLAVVLGGLIVWVVRR